jgi:hypothetical protein
VSGLLGHLRSLSPSAVIAGVALFAAIGGGAYAAGGSKDSVRSKHIVDGTIRSADIRDGSIQQQDLGRGAGNVPFLSLITAPPGGAKGYQVISEVFEVATGILADGTCKHIVFENIGGNPVQLSVAGAPFIQVLPKQTHVLVEAGSSTTFNAVDKSGQSAVGQVGVVQTAPQTCLATGTIDFS